MTQQASQLGCAEAQRLRLDRRGFVKAGMLGSMGLSLAELLRNDARANQNGLPTPQHNAIILWMRGGPSHIDMWDPKPDAPAEYRGEFGVMRTNVPGILLCDLLPRSSRIMDKWSIIRS